MAADDRAPEVASLAATVLEEETRRRTEMPGPGRDSALPLEREPALELRGVDFSYGKVQVLFGVDLAVGRGETLALLGSNGAGKSTLLRVVSGLNHPDRGAVRLNGVPITATIAEHRVRLGVVQLIGGEATFPTMSVVENLRAGAYRYARQEAKERVERALDLFPMLAGRRAALAADLSGGQQHMLALAIALMHDPEVLLIDELSLGLAPVVVQQVLDVVRDLKARDMTMILVEQSVDVALGLADRAVVMEKGEIRFAGTAQELASRDDLVRSAFLGRGTSLSSLQSGLLAFDVSKQVVFSGVVNGATYGIMAVGIILIYRSTRVINLAIAQMGGVAAAILARLVINWDVNYWVAFAACVTIGGGVGWAIDRFVIRRLFDAPRVIVLVATIGVGQLLLFGQAVLPQPDFIRSFPTPFTSSWTVGGVLVRSEHVLILVVIPLLTGALAYFLNRTKYGIAVRAAAVNPDAARLSSINVKRMSTLVWVLAGLLATIATILSAPITTTTSGDLLTLGPALLLRVLVAALIGRMISPVGALAGGIAIGAGEALLFYNRPNDHGILDLALLVVLIVALIPLARRSAVEETRSTWSFSPRVRAVPAALERVWWVRRLPQIGLVAAVLAGCAPLVIVHGASQQELWSRVLLYAMIALSLTVLTGWAGQLSLGQVAFVGLGALTTAALVNRGVGFFPALGAAAAIGCVVAIVVGAPALRIPGLFLAVTTLALAVATSSWVLTRSIFLHGNASVTMPRAVIGSFSFVPERTYYALCLVALVLVVIVVSRLRRSGFGRSLIAVRDNERATASMGLSPARVKLTAFVISGAIAGFAGGLLAGLYVTIGPERFQATESLQAISIAVIGGLASVSGTILGALFVVGIPVLFSNNANVGLLTSGVGILAVLLFFPGGLAQILFAIRDAVFARVARRLPAPTERAARTVPVTETVDLAEAPVATGDLAILVRDLTVRFGNRLAVDGVDFDVRRGEIVGLIGSNGAGKSTVMNAIGGFVESAGRVEVLGQDVEGLAPARRARLGLGRTFQSADLFGDLDVRETVALALESRATASLATVALGLPRARRVERAKQARADEIIAFLGMGDYSSRFVNELSTGTRRILELACLIASGAHVLCLDEPTAGLAEREAEAFGPLIVEIRRELDASVLVIEHDMAVVMGISDRLYCLEAGRLISAGTPDAVRSDPLVIASYLGAVHSPLEPTAHDH